MWRDILTTIKTVITLAEELQANREEIKEIRQELRQLTGIVQRLAADVEHTKEREESERAKLILQLQNALLLFERRLPSPEKD
jgi:molecular chaperone GrpE (heat shock protein)